MKENDSEQLSPEAETALRDYRSALVDNAEASWNDKVAIRERERQTADQQAVYNRAAKGNLADTARQEELLRDAREYVGMSLAQAVVELELPPDPSESDIETACERLGDRLMSDALRNYVPTHRHRGDFRLGPSEFKAAVWTEGSTSLEDRALTALVARFLSLLRAAKLTSDRDRPSRSQRGRPQEIPDERKAAAAAVKASGGSNKEAAAALYNTKRPTQQQAKNVPAILKHFQQKSNQ